MVGVVLLGGSVLAVGCGGEAKGDEVDAPIARSVLIGQENVITVKRDAIVAGPIISGELKPDREAVLRAQLGGSVLEVNVKEGQTVKKDAILARIEARSLEDARRSVESSVRSAENQVQVSQREMTRVETLVNA